jgi:hypothetical protein
LPVGEGVTLEEEFELAVPVTDDPVLVAVALDEVVVPVPNAAEI